MDIQYLISLSISSLNDDQHFETLIRLSDWDYNYFNSHTHYFPFLEDYHCSTITRVIDCIINGIKEKVLKDSTIYLPIKDSKIYNVSIHVEKL